MQGVQQDPPSQSCGSGETSSTENLRSRPSRSLDNKLPAKTGVILFDTYKHEAGDPSSSYRRLTWALKQQGFQCRINDVSLTASDLKDVGAIVFGQPTQPFTAAEFGILKAFFEGGGSLLFLMGEGGETRAGTNVNYFLEEYGMSVCADAVVRMTVASPVHLHPKEALIGDGVLCRDALNKVLARNKGTGYPGSAQKDTLENGPAACQVQTRTIQLFDAENDNHAADITDTEKTPFVFPYGATVSVQTPAFPFLSSGLTAYPSRRPLAAAYVHPKGGRLVALGSYRIFDDDFLEKENNPNLQVLVFQWLLGHQEGDDALRPSIEVEASLEASQPVPDTTSLSERPLPCFYDTEEALPSDFRKLFEETKFALDTSRIADVKQLYRQLGVNYEPLSVIKPEFVIPLPPLRPAVHPPFMPELPHPPLELFDIDAEIASPRTRLIQLANQCVDDSDLEIHLQRAAQIIPVPLLPGEDKLAQNKNRSAKNILCSLIYRIIEMKIKEPVTAAAMDKRAREHKRNVD
ncbi:intraflagellar transport 52 (Protein NGD5) family protein [Toxoplasma gondii MAS]|uniref:Intraflagellar transport 52 (Protein NGD5 ) family protein n=2 Tax=Toxoplasma gondii TaxID=5811 RepID=A0A086PWV1_TOXGO|nr:intraflagellar transport 52 (Protein NGD5) family protein [Toxoplasma gondii p89]KFH04833.1 intraflagellar transport 52 (Protein NGD5) family protein [Toxoplasma gondii MAS]